MKLYIGENIKRFRHAKGLTQEEVAAHLGISFQSVSKWERGDGYPDITMLPALAAYFGVSIDELVGVDAIGTQTRYDGVNRQWAQNNADRRDAENIELMRASLKEFPNDPLLLVQLSTSLEKADGTDEEKKRRLQESIALQEQILRYSEDCEVRGSTLYNICFSYLKCGQRDKALEQAKKLPNLFKARENALVCLLTGQERLDVASEALRPIAWTVFHHLSAIAEETADPACYQKALTVIETLFEGDDDFADSLKAQLEARLGRPA